MFQSLISKENFLVTSPGRINLIGEHTDYNGGIVLPFAIPYHINIKFYCSKERSSDFKSITLAVKTDFDPQTFIVSGGQIIDLINYAKEGTQVNSFEEKLNALSGKWQAYIVGCLYEHFNTPGILQKDFPIKVDINISSTLPKGAGISSSAALSCGLLWGLSHAHGTDHDKVEMAIHAMKVEHKFAGTKCGLMDQLAVSLAQEDRFVGIDFKPFAAGGIPIINLIEQHEAFHNYSLVALDTKVKHKLSDSPYGKRRASCEKALELLNKQFNVDFKSLSEFNEFPPLMNLVYENRGGDGDGDAQEYIYDILRNHLFKDYPEDLSKRTTHVLCENVRVSLAATALREGNLSLMAKQINRSHKSLVELFEVSCIELNEIRAEALQICEELGAKKGLEDPILGSRMTGGGFGGSTIQWVHNDIVSEFRSHFENGNSEYERKFGLTPRVLIANPSKGIEIKELN
jgi:galactokinase